MHFNRFVGTTVFHCHILAHEDNGMMGIIDISRTGRLSKATAVKSLEEMNKAMLGQHATGGAGAPIPDTDAVPLTTGHCCCSPSAGRRTACGAVKLESC